MISPTSKLSLWLKTTLSVWIVYHLFCIFILPNASGFLGRYLADVIVPYGNTLSFNTPWNLFSPDPASTMYFSYSIHYPDGHEPSVERAYFPPEKNKLVTDSSERRLLYAMRYLALDPERIDATIGPWLCHEHPGATDISIRIIVEKVPSLDAVLLSPSQNVREQLEVFESPAKAIECGQSSS